ncbi:MAG: hypothetical protein EOQ86_28920 [Mesorhizobium sp.]|uniref:hypothetical protein n=1 Tax=Mesorhizobium sp. TaxID=1871066 RepID=UPI000FEA7593|nr:hypothetical protein [Mesorhizobium sp.]RWH71143.1 MAG: hypothetical protein EOQ85_30040 [Mesorhizobium sp.]RWH77032.1 MAG: hypothetical protein EOQ86_28920 [Mesorhizobium sp.]RWH85397.1 MAG: hypothetical protein EOQ87_30215 [Mesorhizobium sp.]RWH92587.1 MAG: hypothetical protein EOQ88_29205 [Mesorhizobium sp.]RWH96813.1 MAG: hypothetical protein EOQ89_27840 [Mesorhizobium sp.]
MKSETIELLDGEKLVQAMLNHKPGYEKHQVVYADVLKEQQELAGFLDQANHIAMQRARDGQ